MVCTGVLHPSLYSRYYGPSPGGGLSLTVHWPRRKVAQRAGFANGPARFSRMRGWGIRWGLDDGKLRVGYSRCRRYGSVSMSLCVSIVIFIMYLAIHCGRHRLRVIYLYQSPTRALPGICMQLSHSFISWPQKLQKVVISIRVPHRFPRGRRGHWSSELFALRW